MVEGNGIVKDEFTDWNFIPFEVDRNSDIMSAREAIYGNSQTVTYGRKIVAVSGTFDYHMPEVCIEIGENYLWRASCGCGNLLTAFDRGSLGLRKEGKYA